MKRLTDNKIAYCIENNCFMEGSPNEFRSSLSKEPTFEELYVKLNKYEQLEEELGCPLEILISALKRGIYVDNLNGIPERLIVDLNNFLSFTVWNKKTYCKEGYVELKDYKKTWWLEEDKSE